MEFAALNETTSQPLKSFSCDLKIHTLCLLFWVDPFSHQTPEVGIKGRCYQLKPILKKIAMYDSCKLNLSTVDFDLWQTSGMTFIECAPQMLTFGALTVTNKC